MPAGATTSARPAAGRSSLPTRSATSSAQERSLHAGARGHDLHLPHAPRDPPGRSRRLPDLRHGARAGARHGRGAAQSRARRHDAAVLDRAGPGAPRVRAGDGRAPGRLARAASRSRPPTGCSSRWRRRSCCGRAGRSSSAAGPRSERGNLNMFTLIAMGTGVAWAYSVLATVASRSFPCGAARRTTARVPVYFEAAAVITVLVLLGQVLELQGPRADERRHPRPARPGAEARAPHQADGSDEEVDARSRAGGRPAARAARRERSRRRRGAGGTQPGRRIDGHRRVDAGGQGGRRQGDRRHHEPDRQLRHARRQGRPRHGAGADRADGGAGAAQPGADPAAGRSGVGVVRAAGDRRCACGLRRLVDLGAGAAPHLRAHRRRLGADHRLPLRARAGHADVDHGGRRARRAGRRAHQERRGAGALREGRHARRRQDRHADRGQAQGGGDPDRGRIRRERRAAPRREPRARQPASPRRGRRPGRRGSAASSWPRRKISTLPSARA